MLTSWTLLSRFPLAARVSTFQEILVVLLHLCKLYPMVPNLMNALALTWMDSKEWTRLRVMALAYPEGLDWASHPSKRSIQSFHLVDLHPKLLLMRLETELGKVMN